MIYLDNAATSFPKPQVVYDEVLKCMKEYCANPGRGGHKMSLLSLNAVMSAREAIAKFFNIDNPLNICFTKNATEALNITIKGILKQNDHVIITPMEHNSVIRPLKTLEKERNIEVSILKSNNFGEIDLDEIKTLINKKTKLIICTLSSNVNGIIMPFEEIANIANQNGIYFLLDASQGSGSINIDVQNQKIDMLAFSGHKGLLGPQGIGGLYIREDIKIIPLMEGGTGSNSENLYQPEMLPDLLESGTLNTPGIVGLGAGINFINEYGIDNLRKHKYSLINRIFNGIKEFNKIKIYSKNDFNNNSGVVAFNFDEVDSTEVSYVLDKVYNIATRAGLHCAPLAHKTFGTISTGIVRVSVGCFNSESDIDLLLNALREIHYSLMSNS